MKKFGLKKVYLLFSSAFIFVFHIPFVFAKSKPIGKLFFEKSASEPTSLMDSLLFNRSISSNSKFNFYDSLR
ncbi:MAG: hypothetical protein ABIS01_16460, partial [Ferruginibacter sp.]